MDSLLAYYGLEENGPAVLELGSINTRQGRLLAFPNVLQHQVQPFELVDKTRSGHRKILAMFLVDPHVPVLSTANVPPQSKAWWSEEVRKIEPFGSLPLELFELIIDCVDGFPMSWEDAITIRKELMRERGAVDQRMDLDLDQVRRRSRTNTSRSAYILKGKIQLLRALNCHYIIEKPSKVMTPRYLSNTPTVA
jgi:hypothetical protein